MRQALGNDRRWKTTVTYLKEFTEDPAGACDFPHATGQWADLMTKAKNMEHANGKRRGWESWVAKQTKAGGGLTRVGQTQQRNDGNVHG